MVINLNGNVSRRAREYEQATTKFGTKSARSMRMLKTSTAGAMRGLGRLGNRYTAFLGGLGLGAAAKGVISFGARLKDVQVQAGLTDKEMTTLKKTIFDVAQMNHIKVDPSEILAAFDAVIEKTGDFELANDNIRNMGEAIRASGGAGKDIGAIIAGLKKMGVTTSEDVGKAFNVMNAQGKAGAFTMKMIATEAGPMLANMAAMGYEGIRAIRVMGAVAQTTQDTTDSAAETGTAFTALLREITSKGKMLQGAGITVFDKKALDEGKEKFLEIDVILKSIINKTEGKMSILTSIFGEEAQKAIKNLAAGYGKSETMFSEMMGVSPADNQLIQDAADKATTMDAALTNLNTTVSRLADAKLSGPIQELSDFLGDIKPDEMNEYADNLTKVAIGIGGLVVATKTINGGLSMVNGIRALRSGGRKGNPIGTALNGGGQPVFVTNWPGGMSGGINERRRTKNAKSGGFRKAFSSGAASISGAGAAGGIGARSFGFLKGGAKSLGKRLPLIGSLIAATGLMTILTSQAASAQEKLEGTGSVLGGMGGASAGAIAGAAVGSVVPVIGTAIGGLIGAIAGGIGGEYGGGELARLLGELIGVTKENGAKQANTKLVVETAPGLKVRETNAQLIDAYRGQTQLGG